MDDLTKNEPLQNSRKRILELAAQYRAEDLADAKRAAIAVGREVVTPSGAQFLFHRSATRIRAVARAGEIETRFRLAVAGRVSRVYSLASCTRLWGDPPADRLETLRQRGEVVGIFELDADAPTFWLLLSESPLGYDLKEET